VLRFAERDLRQLFLETHGFVWRLSSKKNRVPDHRIGWPIALKLSNDSLRSELVRIKLTLGGDIPGRSGAGEP
jgi:hypothetical protein